MEQPIELITVTTGAAETPWSTAHYTRILTSPEYAHLDPRPKIRRLPTGRTNCLVRSEHEEFKVRLAEMGAERPPRKQNPRDQLPPELRNTNPRKIALDRKRQEAEASA